jgi:hypothetical protein
MKKSLLIISSIIIIIVLVLTASYFSDIYYRYKWLQNERIRYPSTHFIEPSNSFVACYKTDDCIKVKGTACPPSKGGAEICINKEHMQEYLSNIEILSGKEWEVECPNINNSTNKDCSCINNVCKLVSE